MVHIKENIKPSELENTVNGITSIMNRLIRFRNKCLFLVVNNVSLTSYQG